MQRLLGVDQPDFGHLLTDFFFIEHEPIPLERFLQPRIEPEVAFVLSRVCAGPGVTVAGDRRGRLRPPGAGDRRHRIDDWKIGLFDTIADNASSGAVVLGSRPTLHPRCRPSPRGLRPDPQR